MAKRPPKPPGRDPAPRFMRKGESESEDIGLIEILKTAIPFSSKEYTEILILHRESDDHTAAILASSHLDQVLSLALYLRLSGQSIPRQAARGPTSGNNKKWGLLHKHGGALSTLSSKIDLWYAAGVCSKKMFDDLHVIRRVRNRFAHSWKPTSFHDELIMKECRKINFRPLMTEDVFAAIQKRIETIPSADRHPFEGPYERHIFVDACEFYTRTIVMDGIHDRKLMEEQREMIEEVLNKLKPKL